MPKPVLGGSATGGRDEQGGADKASGMLGRLCFFSHKSTKAAILPGCGCVAPAARIGDPAAAAEPCMTSGFGTGGGAATAAGCRGCRGARREPPRESAKPEAVEAQPLSQRPPSADTAALLAPAQAADCGGRTVSGDTVPVRCSGVPIPWHLRKAAPAPLPPGNSREADLDGKSDRRTLDIAVSTCASLERQLAKESTEAASEVPGEAEPRLTPAGSGQLLGASGETPAAECEQEAGGVDEAPSPSRSSARCLRSSSARAASAAAILSASRAFRGTGLPRAAAGPWRASSVGRAGQLSVTAPARVWTAASTNTAAAPVPRPESAPRGAAADGEALVCTAASHRSAASCRAW